MRSGVRITTNRRRASQRWTRLLATVLYVLMPAVAATTTALEGIEGKQVPAAASKARKADEPPPLNIEQKPEPAPARSGSVIGVSPRWAPYGEQVRSQMIALVKPKIDAMIKAGPDKRGIDLAVAVWVGQDGRIDRVRFDRSSGDSTVDAMIDSEFRARLLLPPPPNDMPQPIKVDISYYGQRTVPRSGGVPRFNLR